jgi:hypothetical protein
MYFYILQKITFKKIAYFSKIYCHTSFQDPILSSASVTSLLQCLKVRDLNVWRRGHLQWHDLRIEFRKNLPIGSKVIRGDRQADI